MAAGGVVRHGATGAPLNALFRFAHDVEDQRVRILRLGIRMIAVLFQDDALADSQILQFVGSPPERISSVSIASRFSLWGT